MITSRDPRATFKRSPITEGAVLVAASGKLRGSAARQLGELLRTIAEEGTARVVLDFRSLCSIDSLGTFALEEGLDRGLRLHLVVSPAFQFDDFFKSRSLARRGLRIHRDLEAAVAQARGIVESGLALV